jgi:hypothetical protein
LQKVDGDIILNESINSNPSIRLSHKQRQFTIEFAALNFIESNRNKYKYKLEGYDSDWISLGNARSVTFRNLKAGDYVFKVKSANSHNVWNETARTGDFYKTSFLANLVCVDVLHISYHSNCFVNQMECGKTNPVGQ